MYKILVPYNDLCLVGCVVDRALARALGFANYPPPNLLILIFLNYISQNIVISIRLWQLSIVRHMATYAHVDDGVRIYRNKLSIVDNLYCRAMFANNNVSLKSISYA